VCCYQPRYLPCAALSATVRAEQQPYLEYTTWASFGLALLARLYYDNRMLASIANELRMKLLANPFNIHKWCNYSQHV
jgi:hypothetical protein